MSPDADPDPDIEPDLPAGAVGTSRRGRDVVVRRLRALGTILVAPALALLLALLVTTLVLVATGSNPLDVVDAMATYAKRPRSQTLILNTTVTYYLSAIAVAIGFRMGLFNIGVDGQYRLAALLAASVGGAVSLPAPLHVAVTVATAVAVGAAWAGVAGLLKVYRGVSEVISTIMLNFIATALAAYLLAPGRLAVREEGSNNLGTREIPASGQVPGIPLVPDSPLRVYGLAVLAVVVGVGFWFVLDRTRFGFDLRAAGANETAAVASGVDVKRMVVVSMLLSGAVAGLVGMPHLLGASHTFALDFPAGLGFTGIAIALLGRNHALGIFFGALLFSFLDNASTALELHGIPKEIVRVTQGVTVLSVVVTYELVRRWRAAAEQREVARQLGAPPPLAPMPPPPPPPAPPAPTPQEVGT